MAQSKITLIGFNNYMSTSNDDLFKYLELPAGIDRDTLINNILLRGGEFETLYADPYFLQNMIGVWSKKWQRTFQKWIDVLNIDYEPLYNFDRYEEYSDSRTEGETVNRNMTNSESSSRGENVSALDHSISNGSGETTNDVSAYDSSTYSPHDKSNSTSNGENTSTATTNVTGNDSRSASGTDNSNKLLNSMIEHTAHLYGNIGVTTSQQMLKDELDIQLWNIYEHITDLFLNEFAIYVYE